ncbi:MAG: hypothetical protein ACRC7G_13775 [Beijerinckiaceae bacterium]
MGPLIMGAINDRAEALTGDLLEGILAARFAPGASYPVARVATLLRATPPEIEPALRAMVVRGLIERRGETIVVADIDRERLVALLPRRRELEILFIRAVAANAYSLNAIAINEAVSRMMRCAVVGDLDGYMLGNQLFHDQLRLVVPDEAGLVGELDALRTEFRRAWCAFNRLRELTSAAGLLAAVAKALIAGDEAAAVAAATAFLAHLGETF